MLRKKITAWVLTAAMLTGLGAAAPVTAFAQTAEDVQQNRCYINGDEVRAYDVEDTIYVVVDDLSAYGFNVQKSKKSVTITSGTNGYYFDESFSPNTESSTMGTGSVKTSTIKGKVADQAVTLYTIDNKLCIKAEDLGGLGYTKYDSDKNIMNIYPHRPVIQKIQSITEISRLMRVIRPERLNLSRAHIMIRAKPEVQHPKLISNWV